MIRKWFITVAVILVLGAAILAGVRSVQPAKAASPSLIYLTSIGVRGSDYTSHPSYHRGSQIDLWVGYDEESGDWHWITLHPAVYHSSYRLLNISTSLWAYPYGGYQENDWWVTIPKNAPLGTYKYWFTLSVPYYANQTLLTTFTVVK